MGQTLVLPVPRLAVRTRFHVWRDCEFVEVGGDHRFERGDLVQVRAQANARGYLYLFDVGTSGEVRKVFPDPDIDDGQHLLPRRYEALIPPERGFEIAGPAGTDLLVGVFSLDRLQALDRMPDAHRALSQAELGALARFVPASLLGGGQAGATRDATFVSEQGEDGSTYSSASPAALREHPNRIHFVMEVPH